MSETTAERIKAHAKVPVASLIHPEMRVMNPRAAGASLPPTESPTAAAMIAGMEDRLSPIPGKVCVVVKGGNSSGDFRIT